MSDTPKIVKDLTPAPGLPLSMIKNGIVKKASGAIQIRADKLSGPARKIYNVLLLNAFDSLRTRRRHEINLYTLNVATGIHDYEMIKECILSLESTPAEFNILEYDKTTTWTSCALLGVATIKGNTLTYGYIEELAELLYNPSVYARISIEIQSRLNSKYSLLLHEQICNYYNYKKEENETPFIDLADFRDLLGCEKDKYYENFKYLSFHVIKKAVAEINEKSDFIISPEYLKKGKTVIAIKFKITPKNDKSAMMRNLYASEQAQLKIKGSDIYMRLVREYGLTDSQAMTVIANLSEQEIKNTLFVVTKSSKIKKIDNISSYTVASLNSIIRQKQLAAEAEHENEEAGGEPAPEAESLITLLDGKQIEIDGTVYTIDGGTVLTSEGVLPAAAVRKGLAAGKYKLINTPPPAEQKED